MNKFEEALTNAFGSTELEVLETIVKRGFYTPDKIRTKSSRSLINHRIWQSIKLGNDK